MKKIEMFKAWLKDNQAILAGIDEETAYVIWSAGHQCASEQSNSALDALQITLSMAIESARQVVEA